jgi:hypothetical protein
VLHNFFDRIGVLVKRLYLSLKIDRIKGAVFIIKKIEKMIIPVILSRYHQQRLKFTHQIAPDELIAVLDFVLSQAVIGVVLSDYFQGCLDKQVEPLKPEQGQELYFLHV